MVDYTSSTLAALSSTDFNSLATYLSQQSGESVDLRTSMLNYWKDRFTSVWLAKDGSTIVGSYLVCPANNIDYIVSHTDFNTYLTNNSLERADCVVSLDIYVHPDYSGQGIYTQLKAKRGQANIDAGYTYSIGYGYQADSIKTLAESMSGIIDTGCTDQKGNKIHLIPLTSYL